LDHEGQHHHRDIVVIGASAGGVEALRVRALLTAADEAEASE
jgi:chemotaxis response regulator CheB